MAQEIQNLVKNLVEPHAHFPLCRALLSFPHLRTAYDLGGHGRQSSHLHPVRMTPQGVFHPEARILARAHGVQLATHGIYSLALLLCQYPLRRELWHEEMQVVKLQSEFIG